jgi:hypothetical protein
MLPSTKTQGAVHCTTAAVPSRHCTTAPLLCRLLQAPRVKSMSQDSSFVYPTIIRSQVSSAIKFGYAYTLQSSMLSWNTTLLMNVLPHLTITRISKRKSPGCMFHDTCNLMFEKDPHCGVFIWQFIFILALTLNKHKTHSRWRKICKCHCQMCAHACRQKSLNLRIRLVFHGSTTKNVTCRAIFIN